MAEVGIPRILASSSTSPPPNCAICLGTCTNKCFSDSCMHQFCFTCLLEWSKIKAECPLCKQAFTSIIHNVKSNNEYDEHIIQPNPGGRQDILDENEFLYLPTAQPSRHFQFRTTFTVDPRGELAIQQMLLTHRLTNSVHMPNFGYNYRNLRHRHRRDISSTNFRRLVYARSMWVTSPPDITGRYRDISPLFYRENPAAINRLVPWLNRELNTLLEENTQQVMLLVDIILGHLSRHHIRGFFFKNLLREYLGNRTEHFIHEFYNFMKSPYDMVGYDRHVSYSSRASFIHTIASEDNTTSSDSDITVVATTNPPNPSQPNPNPNPFQRPTIEIIEINSDTSRDSDVIIHEPVPPVVVDLINTTDDDVTPVQPQATQTEAKRESNSSESDVKPKYNLVSKKEKRAKIKYEKGRRKHRPRSSRHNYSSTDSDSDSSSSDSNNYKYYKRRKRQKAKKVSRSKHISNITDSTDDEPLSDKVRKMKKSSLHKSKKKDKSRKHYKHKGKYPSGDENYNGTIKANNHYINVKRDVPSPPQVSSNYREDQYDSDKPLDYSMAGFAGPSYQDCNAPRIKKERNNLWYSRPQVYDDTDSSIDN